MTDFCDACFSCGGHLRANAYGASDLCPICEHRHEQGEITMFGDPVEQLTEVHGDPLLKNRRAA